ncbi:hypothetical protein [Glycomyces tritici]|uniref:PQQ-binding-like beta-propeller repeat protein n=1 Tax=Glycomyces tritici TaxID=2665176 RepID=A0ABT7YXU3_9ACTN|nr:hypothetical protein [Glycomyces tritici]MDN3243457.1 hypothetical protein [Glycomyces tritici]
MGIQVRAGLGAAMAAALLLISACGEANPGDDGVTDEAGAEEPTESAPAPELPAFDPPTKFDAAAPAAMPAEASDSKVSIGGTNILPLPVALSGTTAFVASVNRLQVVDAITGEVLTTVEPELAAANQPGIGVFVGSNPTEAPLVAEVDGTAMVLVPFVVDREAAGTEAPGRALELIAVDAATFEPAFTATIDLADWADDSYNSVNAVALAHSEGVVAVEVSGGGSQTIGIDLATREAVWTRDFGVDVVAGDTLVGWPVQGSTGIEEGIAGLSVKDGEPKWQGNMDYDGHGLKPAGPKFFVSIKDETLSYTEDVFNIVDAATGTVVDSGVGDYALIDCLYDGAETTTCFRRGEDWAGAFDAATGEWLWSLPDEAGSRIAPMVTTVWHGAVYGLTENGPVVLDARTGADLEVAPGAAPYLVNEYVGIAADEASGGVAAFPATA